MDEVLKILHNPHEEQEIVTACNVAISIIQQSAKRSKNDQTTKSPRFDEDQTANCFMVVLLSNFTHRATIISITHALVELVTAFPHLKSKIGEKGLFFNIMELSQQTQQNGDNTFLMCSLQIAVALIDGCPSNLVYCMEAGITSLVPLTFQTCSKYKEGMDLCFKLMAILLTDQSEHIHGDIEKYRPIWLNQMYHDKVDETPLSGCILDAMNRFLMEGVDIQLNGVKILIEFVGFVDRGIEQLEEHSVLDTTVHACYQYDDHESLLVHGLKLLRLLMLSFPQSGTTPRSEVLFSLITSLLEKHVGSAGVMKKLLLLLSVSGRHAMPVIV